MALFWMLSCVLLDTSQNLLTAGAFMGDSTGDGEGSALLNCDKHPRDFGVDLLTLF
jgi:hypothetical protein